MKQRTRKYLFFISQDYSYPVLRPIQNVILERGDDIKWFLYGSEITEDFLLPTETRLETVKSIVEYDPDAVFVPGNVVPSFISGLKIQVFHGLPSRKSKKNGQLYHYIIREMFDLYCTQGPQSTKIFQNLSKKYKNFSVIETGWSKLDPLFRHKKISSKHKTIFFASTFSPRFSKAKILFPFIKKMVEKYDFKWHITLHPKMPKEIVILYKSLVCDTVTFVNAPEVIGSLEEADIMLCDTSSIIYEFLTQLKPVITFQTEHEDNILINVHDISKLEQTILKTLHTPEIYQKSIQTFIQQVHPYTDGLSSQRIINAVEKMIEGNDLPLNKKPYNILRNLKLRKHLDYWKL